MLVTDIHGDARWAFGTVIRSIIAATMFALLLFFRAPAYLDFSLAAELTGSWASVYDSGLEFAGSGKKLSGWAWRKAGSARGMTR